nr:MerR family transcriptional regulator [Maliibacterium massiliense]
MKTVKEVSQMTGISIRALRYYDEIGLLKPTACTDARCRLYDADALEKLQLISLLRELEVPLTEIKRMLALPREAFCVALRAHKKTLVRRRNRLNGLIAYIEDTTSGGDAPRFAPFDKAQIDAIFDHALSLQSAASIQAITDHFGSIDALRAMFTRHLQDEAVSAHVSHMYANKEKAVCASLQHMGDAQALAAHKDAFDAVYWQFAQAMQAKDEALAMDAVQKLANIYQAMFRLDNARYLLLKVAADYLENQQHPEVIAMTEAQYGAGIAAYIGRAIRQYFGV